MALSTSRSALGLILLLLVAAGAAQEAKLLRNEDIAAMAQAGLGESAILLSIEANPYEFDVSPAQLMELRKQKVSDGVIRAMLAAETRRRHVPPAASAGLPATVEPPPRRWRPIFPVEFFAEKFASADGPPVAQGSLYVGRGRLRFEGGGSTLIIDPATLTGYVLDANQPARAVSQFQGLRGTPTRGGLSRYLLPVNPADPCAYWIEEHCKRLGVEDLHGRSATKWELTQYFDDDSPYTTLVWVDSRLHIVSKLQSGQYLAELRNIVEGPQPAGLFELPAQQ